ncbi:uncharacterized protein LOC144450202 isoform X1 [Glandiceps talaboti]
MYTYTVTLFVSLIFVRLSIQQLTFDKNRACFENNRRCSTKQECAYTFVLPRPNGDQCQSVQDTVVEMAEIKSDNENLEEMVESLQQENEEIREQVNSLLEERNGGSNDTFSDIILSIDGCLSMPCHYGGTCVERERGYTCSCREGYNGRNCEAEPGQEACWVGEMCSECQFSGLSSLNGLTVCCPGCRQGVRTVGHIVAQVQCVCDKEDSDECLSSPCQNGGTCQDMINGFVCRCMDGYTGIYCELGLDAELPVSCTNTSYHDSCDANGKCPYEYKLGQKCINGQCICELPEYSKCSCLPSVGECVIERHYTAPDDISKPADSKTGDIFTCRGINNMFDVHVLAVNYGYPVNVTVLGSGSGKPIILVFIATWISVWEVTFSGNDVVVEKALLISRDVYLSNIINPGGEIKSYEGLNRFLYGFGDDRDGYYTVGLLKYLQQRFGPITSFTGKNEAYEWVLDLDAS